MPAKPAKKSVKSDWKVPEDVQRALLSHISDELAVADRNNKKVRDDFDTFYKMMHSIRDKKVNDWESDISLPEFEARMLAQMGAFLAQYFSSTDFVEPDIDSSDPKDVAEAKASKTLLNTLLKDKDAHYYHKVSRLLSWIFPCGYGIIKGGYEQKVEQVLSHYERESIPSRDAVTGDYLADDGTPFTDPTFQRPAFDTSDTPVYKDNIVVDRPVFDVYPNVNVYMSPEYTYTLNDKEYVIFETEKTLGKLRDEADQFGYVNLDLLEQEEPEGTRGEKTYNKDSKIEEQARPVDKTFVIYERWGKYPVIVKDNGTVIPGITKDGEWDEKAELKECIIYYAKNRESDDVNHIIGFRISPHSKRPMVRFLCYVDPINDNGFGDGEITAEIQKAINDNYNLMNYRTRLSITPAFKGKKFSGIPENIRLTPEKVIMMENIDNDLKEIMINPDIQGGVIHHNLLTSRMDYVMATSPQTMGASPERAETATVGSIMNQRTNLRQGMRSMNLEFIGFTEFYDMLLTLVNDFMLPETLQEILGEQAFNYNPKRKDKFKPVSQALETEESKNQKIKAWQGIMQMVGGLQNPKTPMVINYAIGQMLELMGGSFKTFKKFMLEENPQAVMLYQIATGANGSPAGTPPNGPQPGAPVQNQAGLPQRPAEQATRAMAPNQ